MTAVVLDVACLVRFEEEMGTGAVVREFVVSYLSLLEGRAEEVHNAVANREARRLWAATASLAVSSTYVGAVALSECCRRLQYSCRRGDCAAVDADDRLLDELVMETTAALHGFLAMNG